MRRVLALVVLVLATFGVAAPAAAEGGWAVTVVDPFDPPAAGEDVDITFSILQHGRTPVDVDGVLIIVDPPDGAPGRFPAGAAGEVGRYRATVSFPEQGRSHWSVVQGWFGEYDLGDLDVGAGGGASAGRIAWIAAPTALAGTALLGGAVWWRRRQPWVSPKPQVSLR